MLVQTAADLRAMVGALATHELSFSGEPVPVIFEAPSASVFGQMDAPAPSLTMLVVDWPTAKRGDLLPAIDGVVYSVLGVEPDGSGLMSIRLGS